VHDASVVGCFQGLRDLQSDGHGFIEGQTTPLDPLGERFALYQFHDQEVAVAIVLDLIDGGDIRVIQRRQHLGFAAEARHPLCILSEKLG
jgi:hypothetical protein